MLRVSATSFPAAANFSQEAIALPHASSDTLRPYAVATNARHQLFQVLLSCWAVVPVLRFTPVAVLGSICAADQASAFAARSVDGATHDAAAIGLYFFHGLALIVCCGRCCC